MRKITASNIVSFIDQLPDQTYNYINPLSKGLIEVVDVTKPEGPIRFKRYNPSKNETSKSAKINSMSSQMIWRVANALQEGVPVNVDRILGASYNTRSVLEALLVHTPQFYYCYPGRVEQTNNKESVESGHKHLLWMPEKPHENGLMVKENTEIVISEVPSKDIVYEALVLSDGIRETSKVNIEVQRRHAQIQIALYFIGKQLGYRTWIAQNDKGMIYKNKKISEYEGVIDSLREERLLSSYQDAAKAALLIDCIWFKNGRLMPAVMEVEQSTGVTSGLSRMKNFYDLVPPVPTRYVIVAPDEDRAKVLRECNKAQFKDLNPLYFPYSSVEELLSLCDRRKIRGITEEFLDCFMEKTIGQCSSAEHTSDSQKTGISLKYQ